MRKTHKKFKKLKKHAFGILLYKKDADGGYSVFLAKANGPRYWSPNRVNIWGLPKGRGEAGESEFDAAKREFEEEIGAPLPDIKFKKMMDHHRPNARQMITVFVGKANKVDVQFQGSNHQSCEWPRKSGNIISYPEIVDARWVPIEQAMKIVLPGQRRILAEFLKKKVTKKRKKKNHRLVAA